MRFARLRCYPSHFPPVMVAPTHTVPGGDAPILPLLSRRMRGRGDAEPRGGGYEELAHDVNNLLSMMLSGPEGLRRDELVARLGELGRGELAGSEVVDVAATIEEVRGLLDGAVGEEVALTLDLGDDAPPVSLQPAGLERILINLLVNAREAFQEEGGRVVVCVERAPDGWARMVVRDDGPGIDPSIAGTALDARVTTKPGGAGLGLRSVAGIVEAAGGRIRLDSASGEGTRVAIELPPVLATVMVVEDLEAVGRQARQILEAAGYAVVEARDAESALRRLDGVDVLVTDLSMPGMSGPELARLAVERDRGLRVVFMSGRARDAVDGGEGSGFVTKPFTAASLCDAVASALAA